MPNMEMTMGMRFPPLKALLAAVGISGALACSDEVDDLTNPPDASQGETVALVSVSPRGGTTGVDMDSHVTVEFDHPMQDGMEQYCALHTGGLDGTEVPGHWEWSENHHRLTFTPDQPFEHAHEYTLHVGGGMQDEHGHDMDLEQHGHGMGGEWVEEHMLGGGGGHMGGHMGGHDHQGDGWQHENGMYGMTYSFTTAP